MAAEQTSCNVWVKRLNGELISLDIPVGSKLDAVQRALLTMDRMQFHPSVTQLFPMRESETLEDGDVICLLRQGEMYHFHSMSHGPEGLIARLEILAKRYTLMIQTYVISTKKQIKFMYSCVPGTESREIFRASWSPSLYQAVGMAAFDVTEAVDVTATIMSFLYADIEPRLLEWAAKLPDTDGYTIARHDSPNESMKCPCGRVVFRSHMARHQASATHAAVMQTLSA